MIRYVENSQIDRREWDNCIKHSFHTLPYAYSWYLDMVTPGWCALVDQDYQKVFPLPSRKKMGIRYIFTPPFMQCLGLFSREPSGIERTEEFIGFIPDFYRLVDLSIINNPGVSTGNIVKRDNYTLSLDNDYPKISAGFSSDCRRNISRARESRQKIVNGIDPGEAIDLFRNGPGKGIRGISSSDYERLRQLMIYTTGKGIGDITGIRIRGKLIYSIFRIHTPGQVTLLFTSTSGESRERRSGYLVTDHIIREYAGRKIKLDFAGSSIPSIAEYIRSFGAEKSSYYRIYKSRLPWPVNRFR